MPTNPVQVATANASGESLEIAFTEQNVTPGELLHQLPLMVALEELTDGY